MIRAATRLALPLLIAAACVGVAPGHARAETLALHIHAGQLVNASGQVVQLRGTTRPGTQYACVTGSFEDGPWDAASVAAMAAWDFNTVRIPLNEDCWLGQNGLPGRGMTPAEYQADVHLLVSEVEADGMYPILDNRVAAPGAWPASGKAASAAEMADADHAPGFLTSLARSFAGDPAVVYDLYNEPNNLPGTPQQQMACVRNGCAIDDPTFGWYQSAGEQSLLDAVRSGGGTQIVLESAPVWASDVRYWLDYPLSDPLGQVAVSVHPYDDSYWLNTAAEWNQYLRPIITAGYPVVATETGSHDCAATFIDAFMAWSDSNGASYLPFGWNPWGCSMPSLTLNWAGTPTPGYGQAVQVHLRDLQQGGGGGNAVVLPPDPGSITGGGAGTGPANGVGVGETQRVVAGWTWADVLASRWMHLR